MSNKYEDLIKNARMNADCGEHMSPTEVTTLLNVVETTFSALAAENALLKKSEPAPFSKLMMEALDVYQAGAEDVPELAMLSAYKKLRDGLKTPATDSFLAEVRVQGVEMFAAHKRERQQALRSRSMRMSEEAAGMAADAENFADELRKGVQS
ncbi:hypothetical protein [Escherichia coli]|uniref:hypothetical protein n=1 Tax=Escherichia coli TaxID=562 RepID=UPI002FF0BE62